MDVFDRLISTCFYLHASFAFGVMLAGVIDLVEVLVGKFLIPTRFLTWLSSEQRQMLYRQNFPFYLVTTLVFLVAAASLVFCALLGTVELIRIWVGSLFVGMVGPVLVKLLQPQRWELSWRSCKKKSLSL